MTTPDPRRPGPDGALRAPGPARPGATSPPSIDVARGPAARVLIDLRPAPRAEGRPSGRLAAAWAWLGRLADRFPARPRAPDAAGLTDRQLADIGLERRDVEGHPGWRGREPAGWVATPWKGRIDRDR